jgi:hypothetical protein
VRDVEDLEDAEDEREARRRQPVEPADQEPEQELLGERAQALSSFQSSRGFGEPEFRALPNKVP